MADATVEAVTARASAHRGPERPPKTRAQLLDAVVRHLKGVVASLEELQKLEQETNERT